MTVLNPKKRFQVAKPFVWLFASFLNPVWLLLAFVFSDAPSIEGLLVWPSSIFVALVMLRLRKVEITTGELSILLVMWALATILIYTLALPLVFEAFAFQEDPLSNFTWPFFLEWLDALPYLILLLPLAYTIGFFPAMLAAFVSYWIIRYSLYTNAPNPSPTP